MTSALKKMLAPYGFENARTDPLTMGGWHFSMETSEFVVIALQERAYATLGVYVGSKIRRKPRAHMRGPWFLELLRGYIIGDQDHYETMTPREQLDWLQANIEQLLNTPFLNSDDLNTWAVKASRRMFGQCPR
ncbi:hypothetical protein [Symmachiella dynata]|uniref:hypothetical protein n=1 Tax=Symmachiella dynata TaxID=2527995 RepID=UPI0030ED083D